MDNKEKYESSLSAAIEAYNKEMAERYENGVEGVPFLEWTDEDEGHTAKLVSAANLEKEQATKALEDEKEAVRKGMAELKAYYKANGFEEADALSTEIFAIAPDYDLYGLHTSACNCFHSGMWEVWCEDFEGVWDFYKYIKDKGGMLLEWSTPSEWLASQKGLVGYIKTFLDECKPIRDMLKAKAQKGGDAK